MEYSVNDLILRLLKKWYIILGCMIFAGVISVMTTQISYNNAVKQYEAYTQEIRKPVSYGSAVATYRISYNPTDNARYFDKELFIEGYTSAYRDIKQGDKGSQSVDEMAELAFNRLIPAEELVAADVMLLLEDEDVWSATQIAAEEFVSRDSGNAIPAMVREQLQVTVENDLLYITVCNLKNETAKDTVYYYFDQLKTLGMAKYQLRVDIKELSYEYTPIDPELTDRAQLSQVVMQEPVKPANLVKTVGTAAVFGFAFSCFGILLATFIKENKTTNVENHAK